MTIDASRNEATNMARESAASIAWLNAFRSGSSWRIAINADVSMTIRWAIPVRRSRECHRHRGPRTGKEAQCMAISSSSSARFRPLRRRQIFARRSCNAVVTACVFVSPVRLASVVASSSVIRFLMFSATALFITCRSKAGSYHCVGDLYAAGPVRRGVRLLQIAPRRLMRPQFSRPPGLSSRESGASCY